jgi:hypothetical protein
LETVTLHGKGVFADSTKSVFRSFTRKDTKPVKFYADDKGFQKYQTYPAPGFISLADVGDSA